MRLSYSCSLYNNIKQPSGLQAGADFHLFKQGIEPKWEDPRCAAGGKWTVLLPKGNKQTLDQYWLHVVRIIHHNLTPPTPDCGILLCQEICTWEERLHLLVTLMQNLY